MSSTPTYTATASGFVAFTPQNPGDPANENPYASGSFIVQRISTYAALATSTEVLQGVVADTHQGTVEQLRGQVRASVVPGSVIVQVAAEDANPRAAAQIASSVFVNLGRTVTSVERGGAGFIALDGAPPQPASPVQIVLIQPAIVGPPGPRWYAALGGLIAGLIVGTAVCIYYMTRSRRGSSRPGSNVPADADTDSYSR
ncbi:hypothetical protein AB4Z42_00545 [Mycobacterium sp. 2YAF39]|uniref:hypothetical protein n=1 Tax=Mycobacterium sp. 2YAF39 TaxID=3233033 RepID=UPI003F9D1069